jgi:hypothetical protein
LDTAAGTAGVVVAVSAAKPAKPAESTAATAALLRLRFHRGAQKKNQNAAEMFFETVCFHNLPYH